MALRRGRQGIEGAGRGARRGEGQEGGDGERGEGVGEALERGDVSTGCLVDGCVVVVDGMIDGMNDCVASCKAGKRQ